MTQISEHFSLEELTTTSHRGIDNSLPANLIPAITDLAERLERVRDLLGHPLHINSAYRCPELNAAVGSKPTSAHMHGRAADFVCPAFGSPLTVAKAIEHSGIKFDQLIEEGTWVHISFDPRFRQQVLTMQHGHYTTGLAA